jgi:hypothetical protein
MPGMAMSPPMEVTAIRCPRRRRRMWGSAACRMATACSARVGPGSRGRSGTYGEDQEPEDVDRGGLVTDLFSRPGDQFGG